MQDPSILRLKKMENEKLKGVYVAREVHQKIKLLAAREGKSIKEIAEELIEKELQGSKGNDSNDKQK